MVSTLALEARGRRFKSCHPDYGPVVGTPRALPRQLSRWERRFNSGQVHYEWEAHIWFGAVDCNSTGKPCRFKSCPTHLSKMLMRPCAVREARPAKDARTMRAAYGVAYSR